MERRDLDRASRRRLACALCATLATAAWARAARAEQAAAGRAAPPRVERTTPPVVVEAVRPAALPEDPSSFRTVIEPEAFAGEQKSVESLLEQTVGVQVRRFGGPGQPAELSIRGSSGAQVVVLLDGVRLNTAQSGGVDLSTIPRELIERIEVSRGGASVQQGSDAIGGVVNIVTRRATAEPRASASVAGGSFGTWKGSASGTGRWRDLELVAGYDGFRTDGDWRFRDARVVLDGVPLPTAGRLQRVNNDSESHTGLLRVGRDLGEHLRLDWSEVFFHQSAGRPGPASQGGELAGQSRTARQRRTRNVTKLELRGADLGASGDEASLSVFHRFDRSRFRDRRPVLGAPIDSDDRNHALGGRVEWRRERSLGRGVHRASVGLELRQDWLDSADFGDRGRFTVGVFLQDELRWLDGRLRLIPALRYDDTEGVGREWLPRLGVVAAPRPWLHLKGNVERSYRVPNFDELFFDEEFVRGNPNLRPEDAWNADVGFELAFERLGPLADLTLEFAAFRNEIENTVVFQLLGPSVVQATNSSAARVRGVELAGGFGLLGWLRLSGNLTLLEAERDDGSPLPGRAPTEYALRAELAPPGGLIKLVGARHYTGEIPLDASGSTRVLARAVYEASLVVDLAQLAAVRARLPLERLALSVTGSNLGDRSVRDARFTPQPPRTLLFGAEGAW